MEFLDALLFAILAGFVNGSYTMPRKYLTKWPDANKWFVFSFFGFLIVPLITTYFLNHNSLAILLTAPTNILAVLFIGGILFGIGMVLFTLSLNAIGMGVAFTLNISLGTIGGSLLPLFVMEPARILTIFGLLECSALILFVLAVLISSRAVKLRDLYKSSNEPIAVKNVSGKKVTAGILFGVFSGIFCSLQGFAYAYSLPVINNLALRVGASELAASNLPWIAIFTSAFIPYMLYQLYLMKKDSTINALRSPAPVTIG